jgi:protein-S-isoprenylcysteine O-methyltransferase Ste14
MNAASATQPSRQQQDPDASGQASATVRLGGWLFGRRTWLPLPLVIALLVLPADTKRGLAPLFGAAIIALGEGIRLWGVHHIGAISRTRSDRLGPLISSGPFALVRNPLYLGNVALWVGFALAARILWMAPVIVLVLGFEYHAIVRWEETLLASRRSDEYRAYAARVPRWLPNPFSARSSSLATMPAVAFSWRDTFFSERGTFVAIAAGYLLLWIKARF